MINNWNSSNMDKLDAELRTYERTLSLARRAHSSITDKGKRKAEDIENDFSDNAATLSSIMKARIQIELVIETSKEQLSRRILLCSHCGEKGHFEARCSRVLNHKNKSNTFVFESYILENDKSIWIVDSGSTNYVCSSLQLIETWDYLNSGELKLKVVEVKVGLHCVDCIKKILKAIKKIQDIETYDVDKQLNKVIVTGNVTTEEVIKALQKIGKSATAWEAEPETQ
uniref:CCHC-type domain-containing protein n=1 Tax=Cannabis sativa TaxID=3483 RepID=A0A803NSY7_CANSA